MKNLIIVFMSLLAVMSACKNDKEDNAPAANTSRTLRYEVSGNFTGSLYTSYTTAGGGTNNEQISVLPWSKEITYNTNVTAATIALTGSGGTAGQQITLVLKRGGVAVGNPIVATAGTSGSFSQSAPVVVF